MSIEGDNAEKKARALLDSLQKYNNKILGDDLEESIPVSYTLLTLPTTPYV